MADGTWSAAEAKAKFSEVMEMAQRQGPQHVTKNGRETVVIVSASDWCAATKPVKSFVDALLAVPPDGLLTDEEAETLFKRDRDPGRRPIEF
jgi:antitoxin Phd